MKWKYKNKPITDTPKNAYGFIYKVTCLVPDYQGFIYIGSKALTSKRTVKLSKKRQAELYSGRGKKPTKEQKFTSSGWETYTTSSNIINELIAVYGETAFQWDILDFSCNKADLLMKEIEYQIKHKVFRTEKSFNQMLKASIYKKNLLCK